MIDDDDDDDDDEHDDDERECYGSRWDGPCCLGAACLHPDPFHIASECFDLEMAEAMSADHETSTPEDQP